MFIKVIHNENRMTNRRKLTKQELAFKNRWLASRMCKLSEIDEEDFDDDELMDQIDEINEEDLMTNRETDRKFHQQAKHKKQSSSIPID